MKLVIEAGCCSVAAHKQHHAVLRKEVVLAVAETVVVHPRDGEEDAAAPHCVAE